MITRAQAEALLTLAESLEACELLDICFDIEKEGNHISTIRGSENLGEMCSGNVRRAVSEIYPDLSE